MKKQRYQSIHRDVYRQYPNQPQSLLFTCETPEDATAAAKQLNAECESNIQDARDWLGRVIELETQLRRLGQLLDEHGNPREIARTEQLAAIHRKHSIYKREMASVNKAHANCSSEKGSYVRAIKCLHRHLKNGGSVAYDPDEGFTLHDWNGKQIETWKNSDHFTTVFAERALREIREKHLK